MSNTKQAETVEEAAIKEATIGDEFFPSVQMGFISGHNWTIQQGYKSPSQVEQLTNYPESKGEQINWFLTNAIRLLDADQMQSLTKSLAERCGLKSYTKSQVHALIQKALELAAERAKIKTDGCDNYWIDKQSILSVIEEIEI